MDNPYSPLVEITRSTLRESVHFGAFAVVDNHGKLLASHGDPNLIAFPRSSEKPLQALPFLEMDGDRKYGLSGEEIAILCASHSGSAAHVKVVSELQKRTGINENDLLCGIHPPSDPEAQRNLDQNKSQPSQNQNNCSGKHTGMILHAKLRGYSIEDYIDPSHPLQKILLNTIAEMCLVNPEDIVTGIDGCSAPNFAVPLVNFAGAFARLVDPIVLSSKRAEACRRLAGAMVKHPEMISGVNHFDTVLMTVAKGKLISKGGAEGYHALGIAPGVLGKDSPGIGIALKVADGDNHDYQTAMYRQFYKDGPFHLDAHDTSDRARPCAVVELLKQLGALDESMQDLLSPYSSRPIFNWKKRVVGEIRPAFHI